MPSSKVVFNGASFTIRDWSPCLSSPE